MTNYEDNNYDDINCKEIKFDVIHYAQMPCKVSVNFTTNLFNIIYTISK